jgi:hypothetical protein
MKRTILLIVILGIFVQLSEAQLWKLKRIELTGGLGTTTFFGDVGGYSHGENWAGLKDITFLQTRYNLSFNIKYRIAQNVNIRLGLSGGIMHATDQRGSNENRGFEVTTTFLEPVLLGEYYILRNSAENSYLFNKGRKKGLIGILRSLDFYAFSGIGGLNYYLNPNDKLRPYVTTMKDFVPIVPLGIGGNFSAYPSLNLGAELGFRYAFSDNLDGYTSQYSSANDVYYFFNLTVTYRLKIRKNVLPDFR